MKTVSIFKRKGKSILLLKPISIYSGPTSQPRSFSWDAQSQKPLWGKSQISNNEDVMPTGRAKNPCMQLASGNNSTGGHGFNFYQQGDNNWHQNNDRVYLNSAQPIQHPVNQPSLPRNPHYTEKESFKSSYSNTHCSMTSQNMKQPLCHRPMEVNSVPQNSLKFKPEVINNVI